MRAPQTVHDNARRAVVAMAADESGIDQGLGAGFREVLLGYEGVELGDKGIRSARARRGCVVNQLE